MANPFENESTRTVDRTPPAKEKQGEQLIKVRVPAAGGGYTNIEIPKWQYDQLYQTGRMDVFPLTGFSTSYSPEAVEIAKQQHPEAYAEPTENVFNDLMFGGAGIYRAAVNGALRGLSGTIREWAPKMTFRSAYGNTPLATAGDAAMVAVPTGYEVNDLIQNGPTVENVTGSVLGLGGLAFEAVPTVMEGLQSSRAYNTYQLGRSLNKAINNYQGTTIPLNVGWGPKQTLTVTRAQRSTNLPLGFYPNRWDVVSEGANPNGAWFQGQLGIPKETVRLYRANPRNPVFKVEQAENGAAQEKYAGMWFTNDPKKGAWYARNYLSGKILLMQQICNILIFQNLSQNYTELLKCYQRVLNMNQKIL